MEWISKFPPLYVWPGDIWIKEPEYGRWIADISTKTWRADIDMFLFIDFPPKTKIVKEK